MKALPKPQFISSLRVLLRSRAKVWLAALGLGALLSTPASIVAAESVDEAIANLQVLNVGGELLVSICSKGQWEHQEFDEEGMRLLAGIAHKYDFPITWVLRPGIAAKASPILKEWHEKYGDEVAWMCESVHLGNAEQDFKALSAAVPWQDGIVLAGNVKYGREWIETWERLGVEAVWGRCYEQSDADKISDRGSPWGFYYLNPDNYKLPNTVDGGLVTVPWLSNDPNLIFWTGIQSQLAFDPDDPVFFGFVTEENQDAYFRLVDQYRAQTQFNKVVPMIVQQEYDSKSLKTGVTSAILDGLFAYFKENNIKVVPLREAVRRYKEAMGDSTPPTYGVWANLGDQELIRNPSPRPRYLFEMVDSPIRESPDHEAATFNEIYATSRTYRPEEGGVQFYYSPDGVPFYERGNLFTYYDKNGLILFDVNNPKPVRITSYLEVPDGLNGYHVLPELSYAYDTDGFIPGVKVSQKENGTQHTIQISIEAFQPNPMSSKRMPYGVMVWGDFSDYTLPEGLPDGAAIVGKHGVFVPFILEVGTPAEREIILKKNTGPAA